MKIFTVVIFLCVSALRAQRTSIKVLPIDPPNRPASLSQAISFSCTTDYELSQCLKSVALLAKVLERYPTERMGQWTFVLAGSARWKQTIKELGGDTESPAFSELDARVTVLEDELFETVDSRQTMLAQRFRLPPGSILDYAVTHEMGHAICGERQENLADKYGFDLRRGIAPTCATSRKPSNTP
jgi:hypothetical protein